MIRPFNLLHIIIILCSPVLILAFYFILRRKSYTFKRYFFLGVSIFNIIFYIAYKFWLFNDPDHNFIIWNELPLHLCNINLILLFFAMLFDNKLLTSFVAVIGSIGAFFPLLFPEGQFMNLKFNLSCLGFYGTHTLIFVTSISLMTTGMYRPTIKSLPMFYLLTFIISLTMFGINTLLRVSGIYTEANYFYTHGFDNPIFNIFRSWIDIDYLYLLPALVILFVYFMLLVGIRKLVDNIKYKKKIED